MQSPKIINRKGAVAPARTFRHKSSLSLTTRKLKIVSIVVRPLVVQSIVVAVKYVSLCGNHFRLQLTRSVAVTQVHVRAVVRICKGFCAVPIIDRLI